MNIIRNLFAVTVYVSETDPNHQDPLVKSDRDCKRVENGARFRIKRVSEDIFKSYREASEQIPPALGKHQWIRIDPEEIAALTPRTNQNGQIQPLLTIDNPPLSLVQRIVRFFQSVWKPKQSIENSEIADQENIKAQVQSLLLKYCVNDINDLRWAIEQSPPDQSGPDLQKWENLQKLIREKSPSPLDGYRVDP